MATRFSADGENQLAVVRSYFEVLPGCLGLSIQGAGLAAAARAAVPAIQREAPVDEGVLRERIRARRRQGYVDVNGRRQRVSGARAEIELYSPHAGLVIFGHQIVPRGRSGGRGPQVNVRQRRERRRRRAARAGYGRTRPNPFVERGLHNSQHAQLEAMASESTRQTERVTNQLLGNRKITATTRRLSAQDCAAASR